MTKKELEELVEKQKEKIKSLRTQKYDLEREIDRLLRRNDEKTDLITEKNGKIALLEDIRTLAMRVINDS